MPFCLKRMEFDNEYIAFYNNVSNDRYLDTFLSNTLSHQKGGSGSGGRGGVMLVLVVVGKRLDFTVVYPTLLFTCTSMMYYFTVCTF